jgi:hypothetical protein
MKLVYFESVFVLLSVASVFKNVIAFTTQLFITSFPRHTRTAPQLHAMPPPPIFYPF